MTACRNTAVRASSSGSVTGAFRVKGNAERPSHIVRAEESIEVEPAEAPPLEASAEEIPLTVLYEDGDVVAIDKPAGMVVPPEPASTRARW